MRALLDAQAVLWFAENDRRLPAAIRREMEDTANRWVLSAVSAWEIIIKGSSGKLRLDRPPVEYLEEFASDMAVERLPVVFEHVYRVASLPRRHGDPFDRMLAAQALVERLPVVTGDSAIRDYGVETIW